MDAPTLRLSNDDLRRVVEDVDAVQAVATALIARSSGRADWAAPATGNVAVGNDGEMAVYESTDGEQRCAMSAAGLHDYRLAVLTALATRNLLTPGVVTASVIGSGLALDLQLAVLRTHVPNVSHVAVAIGGNPPPDQAVLDQLDRDGIGLSLVATPADAVFGANLVVLAGATRLGTPRLAKGAVLVNTTGVDLPAALLDGVHAVFVDDPEGLADSDRTFVRTHPGRHLGRGHRSPSVVADLGRVLAGEHPGRIDHDHVLLVELIGGGTELDPVLAGRIHQAAAAAGLGTFTHN
jgi:ornithine cyclodeaminase/alanine dehydrogenase-like protein (mu-crystallin family)